MIKIIDLTLKIVEGSVINHPNHPRAPLIWSNQRHDITQHVFTYYWTKENVPLFDGLPEDVGEGGKGHGWASEQVLIGTHMGTHIDAPFHFENDPAQDAASISLEQAYGEAILLDLTNVCSKGKHKITIAELEEAESKTGDRVSSGDIVILHTGHTAKYAYNPEASVENYATLYSGLAYDASKWFIDKKVKLVGIDGPNIDCHDMICTAHVNFLMRRRIGKDPILIVENLANLEKIPLSRFIFIAFPLPIVKGSGSPVRAVALIQ
jgi:kynurenine formamidase